MADDMELEKVISQRDKYMMRLFDSQSAYNALLKITERYYQGCTHPHDPCKPCQAYESHVHD